MTVEWTQDFHGRYCLAFRKKKGKIREDEVKEYIRSKQLFGVYVHMIDAEEEQEPQWGEEAEGDTWLLYEPSVIKDEIIQRAEWL